MTTVSPNSGPPSTRQAWLVVGVLWVVAFLNYIDRTMVSTMHGSIVGAVPMSEKEFGLLTSVFLWTYAILSPLAGWLADSVGRSRVIIASCFVWSIVTWLTSRATTFDQLLVTRALMGISEACYIPAALALIADYHPGRSRSLATGVHISGILAGSALGGLGGWLAEGHAWNLPFTLFGFVGVVYAVVLLFTLHDVTPVETERVAESVDPKSLASVLLSFPMACATAFWGCLSIGSWAIAGWMPLYVQENFHVGQGVAGLSANGFLSVASFAGVILGGWWADRWVRTDRRGTILVPLIGLVFAVPGIFLSTSSTNIVWALTGLILYGLARSFSDSNMMPILCLFIGPRGRATAYGWLNGFGCLIGGLAIYAGGWLRDSQISVNRLFEFGGICLFLCIPLLWLLYRRAPAGP